LRSLLELDPATPEYEIVVVDNDRDCSAKEIASMDASAPIHYYVEPIRNISGARNLALSKARADLVAFIDDDERASSDWLARLYSTLRSTKADAVVGPVQHEFEYPPPRWLADCGFFDYPVTATGTKIPLEMTRTSNALVKKSCIASLPYAFDVSLGLSGGEDTDLFRRIIAQGYKCVADAEAIVFERVSQSRMALRWLLRRNFRYGNDKLHAFRREHRTIGYIAGQICIAALKTPYRLLVCACLMPIDRAGAVRSLLKSSYWFGVFSAGIGVTFQEYRADSSR
jgi:succinoglycan biosynthesis protein ExoM